MCLTLTQVESVVIAALTVCVLCVTCQQLAAERLRRARRQLEQPNVFENNRRFIRGAEEEEVTF